MPTPLILLHLARLFLAPVLLYQGRQVRRQTLRLPEAAGARSGLALPASAANQHTEPALRLLVLGDSSAAGVGVARQDLALAQPCAQQLADLIGCPVAWQLLAQSGLDTASALKTWQETWAAQAQPAEMLLLVLGVNDVTAQRSPEAFVQHYAALVAAVQKHTGAAVVLAQAAPPMQHMPALPWPLNAYFGAWARSLNQALQAWCAQGQGQQHQASYLPTPTDWRQGDTAPDGFHPGAAAYQLWAGLAAKALGAALAAKTQAQL